MICVLKALAHTQFPGYLFSVENQACKDVRRPAKSSPARAHMKKSFSMHRKDH